MSKPNWIQKFMMSTTFAFLRFDGLLFFLPFPLDLFSSSAGSDSSELLSDEITLRLGLKFLSPVSSSESTA
jgi:hypothetical protein